MAEEEEEWEFEWEKFEKSFKYKTSHKLIADSMNELFKAVSDYLNNEKEMKNMRLGFINWPGPKVSVIEGLKIFPTKDGKWLATLSFEDDLGIN